MAATSHALDLERRPDAHLAVERLLFERRTWPVENGVKPPFHERVTRAQMRERLERSDAMALGGRPVDAAELQREVDRIVLQTKDPALLREIFAVLGGDRELIGEVIARPIVSARLASHPPEAPQASVAGRARSVRGFACSPPAPSARQSHTAVWTGTEMIVWGGADSVGVLGTGVAGGDVDDDGYDEILCGAGPDPAFGSRLAGFDHDGSGLVEIPALRLDPFGLSYGVRSGSGHLGL